MDLSKSKLDTHKEREGVWVDLDDETRLLVARYLNPQHKSYAAHQMIPYRRAQRMGTLDEGIEEKIELEALSKFVLLDWKGMKNDGADLPYSEKTALEIVCDPKFSWFADAIREFATDISLFREENIEADIDNVKKLSNGT